MTGADVQGHCKNTKHFQYHFSLAFVQAKCFSLEMILFSIHRGLKIFKGCRENAILCHRLQLFKKP